jgi:RNA polymerase sigma-70 factor, ECF subfamily
MRGKIPAEYLDEISDCFRQYNEPLYRFLFWRTRRDHHLAQDLVQHVMMEAAQNWETVRGLDDDGRKRFLYVMANRRAIDAFRKNSVARNHVTQILPDQPAPQGSEPHESVISDEALDRFARCIAALPERQALVATLRWKCGWKNSEIAEALGITPSAVTRRLDAALSRIKREMGPYLRVDVRDPEGGA